MNIKRKHVLILACVLSFTLVCLGFIRLLNSGCLQYYEQAMSPDDLPQYLWAVWPPPGGVVSRICYSNEIPNKYVTTYFPQRGIGAILFAIHADEDVNSQNNRQGEVTDRTDLYVDDEEALADTVNIGFTGTFLDTADNQGVSHRYAGYYVTWLPELTLGRHDARIELVHENGEVSAYSWEFFVLP